jgi:hypothetical protein
MTPNKTLPENEPNRPAWQEIDRAEMEGIEGGIGPIIDVRLSSHNLLPGLLLPD